MALKLLPWFSHPNVFKKHNPNRNGTSSVKPGKVQLTQKCYLLAEGRKTRKFSLILVTMNAIVSNYRGWGFPHLYNYIPPVFKCFSMLTMVNT